MKSPREILLARHQAIEPKLDGIRDNVVRQLTRGDAAAKRDTASTQGVWSAAGSEAPRRFGQPVRAAKAVSPLAPWDNGRLPDQRLWRRISHGASSATAVQMFQAFFQTLWQELIWPCRRTWAGLAAVWVAILVFNAVQAERGPTTIASTAPSLGAMSMAFAEQQELLTELIGPPPTDARTEPPQRPNPPPRSERSIKLRLT